MKISIQEKKTNQNKYFSLQKKLPHLLEFQLHIFMSLSKEIIQDIADDLMEKFFSSKKNSIPNFAPFVGKISNLLNK